MATSLDEWKMTLATSALLVCMLWDIVLPIVKDYVRVPSWIPARLFVLNALTILIVGNVDIEKGNALSPSDHNYLEVLVRNQVKMDVARLTVCVFVGCILSGISIVRTEGGWSSLAALFVSLSFHVATEIYALQNGSNSTAEAGPWFVSSGVILSLGAASLLLLLGGVMLFCKIGRHNDFAEIYEQLSKDEENEGDHDRWEKLRRQVIKSWFAVGVWKTHYYTLSSIFVPGATVIVAICLVVMVAKVACHSSLLHQSNGGGNNLTFYLQCIFIIVGWILMLRRWLRPMLYYKDVIDGKDIFLLLPLFSVVPIFVLVRPLCFSLRLRSASSLKNRKFTALRFILIFLPCVVLLLLLCVLVIPVALLLSFCFVCWFFSILVFDNRFVHRLFKHHRESVLANEKNSKYHSILDAFVSDEDTKYIFWKLNKKSFDRINTNMGEVVSKVEQNYKGLLSIMGIVRGSESQHLRLHDHKKHLWMEAVSRIFSAIIDAKVDVDVRDALEAFRETKDMLMFVDCPDHVVVDPFNIFSTLDIHNFFESLGYEGDIISLACLQGKGERVDGVVISTDEERVRVDELVKDINFLGERMFNTPLIPIHEDRSHYNLMELGRMLRSVVGRVIVSSILKAPDVIVQYSKKWAESLEEEKIETAIELAGKVSALLEKLIKEDGGAPESGARESESGDIEAAAAR